jgi:hypothetical protein
MPAFTAPLAALDAKLHALEPFVRADAERLWACPDLAAVGAFGEGLRKAWRGDQITFGRVLEVSGALPESIGEAGELRLVGAPGSVDEALERVRQAAAFAESRPVTAFSVADLLELAGGGHLAPAGNGQRPRCRCRSPGRSDRGRRERR